MAAAYLAKHGVVFDRAQSLWEDEDYLEIPARTQDEPRWIVLGRIDGQVWAAIVTRRGQAIGSSPSGRHEQKRRRCMKARELDASFDHGTDVTEHLDMFSARRPRREVQRVNVDSRPGW